jgi:hypothetical protein
VNCSPDADESLIVACAPFLLTGIENVVKRGDLAQRTLYVHLASVPGFRSEVQRG